MHFTPFHHIEQLDADFARVVRVFAEFQEYVNGDLAFEFFEKIPEIHLSAPAFANKLHDLESLGLIVPQNLKSGHVHQLHPLLRWLPARQDSLINRGLFEETFVHQMQALNYFLEIGDIDREMMVYENLGVIALHQDEFDSAQEYYKRVFDYYFNLKDKLGLARILAKVVTLEQVSSDQDFLPQLVQMVESQFSTEEREEIILMIQLLQDN